MAAPAFPGAPSPAAGFDAPFELLAACHDRVRQRLDLLARLLDHLRGHGADANAHAAAADVLRYFDIAAPHHHEDEERHLVPVLQASDDPACRDAAAQLLDDHAALRTAWQQLRPLLQSLDPAQTRELEAAARRFIELHRPHLELEDTLVYPAAAARLPASRQATIGHEMAERRGVARADSTPAVTDRAARREQHD